ncbi:MAG: carboxypeptidase-like regulatory domain-containing protein, partial [Deltaproteobacteria bacterium]|nr:carboxypeptidase-like regulatory domain-containing protein [Kofleriaceae bacterium]
SSSATAAGPTRSSPRSRDRSTSSSPARQPLLEELAATGTITGRVLRDGKPVARATVEICDMPLITFQTTPCGSSTFARTALTNDAGEFQLPDIPVGSYSFAVKPDGRWRVMMTGSNCCTRLRAGATFDIGAITVD